MECRSGGVLVLSTATSTQHEAPGVATPSASQARRRSTGGDPFGLTSEATLQGWRPHLRKSASICGSFFCVFLRLFLIRGLRLFLGQQYGFHDFTRMHGFERAVPFAKRVDTAEVGAKV